MKETEFEKIVEQHYEDIYKLIFMLVKNRNDASDITQETFLKVQRYMKGFENRSSVRTWLYRIATNEVKRFFKTKSRERNMRVPPTKNDAEDSEKFDSLREALKKLDKESYEILYLKFFKNMKEKEIAFILNIPEGTVKSRIRSAKEKLKKEIKNG